MQEAALETIKALTEEFLQKMTVKVFSVAVNSSLVEGKESITLNIQVDQPQMLIGQNGQTLFELQRLLTIMANKKLKEEDGFYLDLDVNDYRKKKVEYLKNMAGEAAKEVIATGQRKILPAMSSYERRIVHSYLAGRPDVITQSQGEGEERCVIVAPK